MSLIGHLFAVAFGFLFASIAAGVIVVGAMLFPEISAMTDAPLDQDTMNIVMGFGFIFVSGFALVPALIVVLITEAFSIRSALAYAIGGALVGVGCYLGLVPFDPATLHFDGIVRRHLEIMTGAGIVGGLVYWLIAGRNAGLWRDPPPTRSRTAMAPAPQPPQPVPPAPPPAA
ncbi:MAG: hypothetical protein HZA66_01730 [Rhodopseudomonas palustris]|uniref:Uncharacterized protein n=1 Tax=Rhodopseudomonas palustris TaxID=1076 RepID=A0A933W0B1_RHOPL|nr:hypothetical protein [Rhodopseudomonas palustris]